MVYCAASNKSVMEAIRADYEAQVQSPLQIQYGPSQTLLAAAEVSGTGDLYLPADDSYLAMARERKLLAEEFPLADDAGGRRRAEGKSEEDRAAGRPAAGRCSRRPGQPRRRGDRQADAARRSRRAATGTHCTTDTTVYKTTVNEVANDVKVGAVDAGIVFDAVLHDYDTLEAVAIPELTDGQGPRRRGRAYNRSTPAAAGAALRPLPVGPRQGAQCAIASSAFSRSRATPGAKRRRSRSMPVRCCGRRSRRRSPPSRSAKECA